MSYQLVYTSAAQLLTPGLSGFGVVARSMGMPRVLVDQLTDVCQGHEDEPEDLFSPLYTYRVMPCRGVEYHILSCIQNAGADYSGRRCHIAHNLILTEEEVLAMRRNAARPTPAGLTLALLRGGFWLTRWEGEPRLIEAEPKLTAAALPNASVQQAWKDLTGHKGNARSFYTPPFDQDCLVILPRSATTVQCLQLLHESDWLSAGRGWGCTFCTPGCTDSVGIRRVCTQPGAPAEAYSLKLRRPVLTISRELTLPPPPEPAPVTAPAQTTETPRLVLPYHYVESADEDCYETPAKHRALKRNIIYLSALFLLATGLYLGVSDQADEIGGAARDTMRHFSAWENRNELRNLLSAPFSAETTPARLQQLRARIATVETADSAALKRCVDTLCSLGSSHRQLAAAPEQLAERARELKLQPEQLLRLALHLATEGQDVDDWQQHLSPEARDAWTKALKATPQSTSWQQDARLTAFLLALSPSPTSPQHADPAEEPAHTPDVHEAPPQPIAAPLRPHSAEPATLAALAGHPAPVLLLRALEQAPLTLDHGELILCCWGDTSHRQQLSVGAVHIRPGSGAGEFLIAPDSQDWQVRLCIKDGVMTELSESGIPAAMKLPIPTARGDIVNLLLLPHVEMPLTPQASSTPPPMPKSALTLGEDDLQLLHIPRYPERVRLLLAQQKPKRFPWLPAEDELELKENRLLLPALAPQNTIHPLPHDSELPYNWDTVEEADGSHSIRLRRCYDFSHAMHEEFLRTANSPCGGLDETGAQGSTLARAYSLTLEMEKRKQRQQALDKYLALFADEAFGRYMRDMLPDSHQYLPLPILAHETHEQARSRVASTMSSANTRKTFRQQLRAAITRQLIQRYQKEMQQMSLLRDGEMRLILSRVELQEDGSLAWYFKLEHPHPADGSTQE